ncbi:MAG: 3-deoxy-manno-octulosonate cytidylyltransferase [Ginsengibacter sp.]|jgi:3-deoxy-manno-octulosonate cytidylyltransferase (CMP-KDO synthetase)
MKIIALIPARYAATRFPGKLMQKLGDKTVIRHTYDNTKATMLFDEVIVVTDSEIIFKEIIENGGYALMSKKQHESGSDRIAEAIEDLSVDIVVNVQGDEPFVKKELLKNLLNAFNDTFPPENVQVASLMYEMKEAEDIENPNHVKVVTDKNNNALYFSRSVIPYQRDKNASVTYYKHVGIYAFRKEALMNFTFWEISPLEEVEKLEQLRYLENGIKIKMIVTDEAPISIDTPVDLEKAKRLL